MGATADLRHQRNRNSPEGKTRAGQPGEAPGMGSKAMSELTRRPRKKTYALWEMKGELDSTTQDAL